MKRTGRVAAALLVLVAIGAFGNARAVPAARAQSQAPAPAAAKPAPEALDALLAPIALYPDQLLAQLLESSKIPRRIQEFSGWLVKNAELTGTPLQDAARAAGFEPSLVLLALFPQVINYMADNIRWTTELGQAFSSSREGVFESIQRLRGQALKAGTLKDTPQQTVQLKTTKDGKQAIVIEPANPQVVYVPTYNPQVVYTQPATTSTTVVVKEENNNDAAVAGAVIGFTAGIAIGAAMNNNYYYGPYGWHGSPYMYNDAWDDWYDDREDAREDWYENREDAREDFYDNRQDLANERTERANNAQSQRTERTENRQSTRTEAQTQRQTDRASAGTETQATRSASTEARGSSRSQTRTAPERSGTKSDAFSGYSSGRSERAASSRGKSSRSRSTGRGRGKL